MPIAASATPSLATVIEAAVGTAMRNFGVALPGVVVSYSESSQTATVRPGVHRLVPSIEDADQDVEEELPAIPDVPVMWLVGRGIQVKATLQAGDSVLLVCTDRDISAWQRSGSPQPPDDAREHSWSSAVAIPGLVPDSSPFPEPSDAAVLASKLDTLLRALVTIPLAADPATTMAVASALQLAAATAISSAPPTIGNPGVVNPLGTTGSAILKLEE